MTAIRDARTVELSNGVTASLVPAPSGARLVALVVTR